MKRQMDPYPISSLCRRLKNEEITLNPPYQREAVWRKSQERLLIDSILKNLDIPKIYVRELEDGKWEVVDGQQRLRAISKFHSNEFTLDSEDNKDGLAGKKFSELSSNMQDKFEIYSFHVVVLRDTTDDAVENMFLRMQNGTTLNAAEKRNAMPGKIKIFVKKLAKLPFFESCKFSNKRYAYDHIVAQMLLLEIEGKPAYITNTQLVGMYKRHKDSFSEESGNAKNVGRILDLLYEAFPDKTPGLDKHSVISLFLLFRELSEKYAVQNRIDEIGDWFVNIFEKERRKELKRPVEERDQGLIEYQRMIGNSSDTTPSLSYRHDFLMQNLFKHVQDIAPLDPQRNFSDSQREEIYHRGEGICQLRIKCNGKKCAFDDWEADHKVPWSDGGKTTVDNGQVACVKCNRAKGNKTP